MEEEEGLQINPSGMKDTHSLPSVGTWKPFIWVNYEEKACPQAQMLHTSSFPTL